MRNLYFTIVSILFFAFFLSSCSNSDDSNNLSDDPTGVGLLSFEISPIENSLGRQSSHLNKTTECSSTAFKYVKIALKDSNGNCFLGSDELSFHEIEMDPLGLDTNNDNTIDTWKTSNNNKLLLPVGTYTLEYLAVTNNKGDGSEIILMCPRKSEEESVMLYHNLVKNSLPMGFTIEDGEEHSLQLETLCFKKEHAYEFGLVFISLDDPNPFYLCGL